MHPVIQARAADAVLYEDGLFDTDWELKPIDARGAQATFDILATGQTDQGLRITLGRGTGRIAEDSNGYLVEFASGAVDAALDDSARTITLTIQASTTLAGLKTELDAVTGLTSAYFGGETGTNDPTATAGRTVGGTRDLVGWLRIFVPSANEGLLKFGTAVPTTEPGSRLVSRVGWEGVLPRSQRIYTKRGGSNDVPASIEIWRLSEGELSHYGMWR